MVITRYILKQLIGVTLFVAIVLTVLVMLTQSLRFLELIIETGAPPGIFFKLMGLAVPRFLEVVLPLSLSVAVIFIYSKMTTENEMVILRAAGFDQRRLMMPAIWLATIGFICVSLLTVWLTPHSHSQLENLRNSLKTEYASFLLREGVFNNVEQGVMIYMDQRLDDGTLSGLVIYDTREPKSPPVTIAAKSGRIVSDSDDSTKVVVYDGKRESYNARSATLDILNFAEYTLEVENRKSAVRVRQRDTDEYTFFELLNPTEERIINSPERLSMFKSEVHRRIGNAFSVFTFIFVSLAALLYGSFNRRGQTKRIISVAAIIIAIQTLLISLSNLMIENTLFIPVYHFVVFAPILFSIYFISPLGEAMRQKLFVKKVQV